MVGFVLVSIFGGGLVLLFIVGLDCDGLVCLFWV